MQYWENSHAAVQNVAVLLFDGFSNHCLANTVEPMRAVNRLTGRQLFEWQFVSLDGAVVSSSSGLSVTPHCAIGAVQGDSLIVMPSYGFRAYGGGGTQRALRAAAQRFDQVIGMDTGSWLLAEAGLLDGYQATIHWEELTAFAERFPEVEVLRERYVMNHDRITCSGAMAAFDLILHLIGRDLGQALAVEVAQLFMTCDNARAYSGAAPSAGRLVNRALAVMQEHLEHPLRIAEVAARAGGTQKTLEHRMRRELGAVPATVYRRLRLNLVRKLVAETELSIAEIAVRAGYASPAAMTRAYREMFGTTPRAQRGGGIRERA